MGATENKYFFTLPKKREIQGNRLKLSKVIYYSTDFLNKYIDK